MVLASSVGSLCRTFIAMDLLSFFNSESAIGLCTVDMGSASISELPESPVLTAEVLKGIIKRRIILALQK